LREKTKKFGLGYRMKPTRNMSVMVSYHLKEIKQALSWLAKHFDDILRVGSEFVSKKGYVYPWRKNLASE